MVRHAALLICQLSFFSLIGGCIYLRRRQLGIEPSRSPERTAAREEAERVKLRARMLDDVFQQVRIGKHVEATRPLAKWLGSLDGETAARDAHYIAAQALGWDSPAGSTPSAARSSATCCAPAGPTRRWLSSNGCANARPALTLDSPDDLRTLADYAESAGRAELAVSMRLETPISPA